MNFWTSNNLFTYPFSLLFLFVILTKLSQFYFEKSLSTCFVQLALTVFYLLGLRTCFSISLFFRLFFAISYLPDCYFILMRFCQLLSFFLYARSVRLVCFSPTCWVCLLISLHACFSYSSICVYCSVLAWPLGLLIWSFTICLFYLLLLLSDLFYYLPAIFSLL